MTFELRTYTATPGRLDDVVARFRDHTVTLLSRHGMESLGYWTATDRPDTLIYVVRHSGDPKQNWKAFRVDPDWISAKKNSLGNGEIVDHIDSVFMTPTDFSAIS
ncbi:MAG TPA: NIPSNAP family protein [Galbitalea sp.]